MFAGGHRMRAKKASPPTTGPDAARWAPGDPSRPSAEDPAGRRPSTLLDNTPGEPQAAPLTQLDSLLDFLPENPPGAGADRAPLQPPPESSLAMPPLVAPGQHPRSGAKSMDLEELRASSADRAGHRAIEKRGGCRRPQPARTSEHQRAVGAGVWRAGRRMPADRTAEREGPRNARGHRGPARPARDRSRPDEQD